MDAIRMPEGTANPVRLRQTNAMAWSILDFLEPLLLLVAGAAVLQLEAFNPSRLLFLLALLLVPYLLRWIFYGAPSAGTLADLPMALLFLILTPLTVWVSPYFWELTWPELVRMLWGGAICYGVVNWALPRSGQLITSYAVHCRGRLDPRLALLTTAYLLLGFVLALVGLLNMALVNKIPLVNTVAASLLQVDLTQLPVDESFNPNRVAALLILIAPFPLAWLLAWHTNTAMHNQQHQHGWHQFGLDLLQLVGRVFSKVGWLVLWLLFTGGLLLTQSRTALVAIVVATLLILILTARQPNGGLQLFGALLTLGLLIGMGYFILQIEFREVLAMATTSYDTTAANMVNTTSLSGRVVIWQRALHGIADHPLTGYGLGSFAEIAHQNYPLPGYVPGEINHAHNLFLQTALDLGVPGLITFATIVGLASMALVCCYRMAPAGTPQATWAVGMLGSFTGFLIYNLFDGLTLGARPAVAMWFLLGLALAAGQRQALIDSSD